MLQCIRENNSSDVKYYLKYCSIADIQNLRKVCREIQTHIPLDWTVDYLFVSDRMFSHYDLFTQSGGKSKKCTYREMYSTLKKCLFLEKIHLTHIETEKITLSFPLEHLSSVMVLYCLSLEKIEIKTTLNLKDVFINRCPSLKELVLPRDSPIESVHIFNTLLDSFTLHEWKNLQSLVWVNNEGDIDTLRIPKVCTRIQIINLSGSTIETLIIEPELEECLCIQANHIHRLRIHTLKINQSKILINMASLTDDEDHIPYVQDFGYVFMENF
jgi:hypothetical protein